MNCKYCGKRLVKRLGEDEINFKRRKFCSRSCASKHAQAVRTKPNAAKQSTQIDDEWFQRFTIGKYWPIASEVLTADELKATKLQASGYGLPAIAKRIKVSTSTVREYLKSAKLKLEVRA